MPRNTNLVLTEQQESKLVEYVIQRLQSLRADSEERIAADRDSWLAYENDVKYREGDKDSVFNLSNVQLPLTAMITEYFMARAEEAVVDQAPYFEFDPIGAQDAQRAKDYNAYYNWKIDTKAKTFAVVQDAMLPFFIQRATIFKSAFVDEKTTWLEKDKSVLHDLRTGKPVEIAGVGLIIEDEDVFDELGDPSFSRGAEQTTRLHLRADPTFVFDESLHEWKPVTLKREEVLYRGPKSTLVEYDHFLCPNSATSIDKADVIAECYDQTLDWFGRMWLERPWAPWQNALANMQSGDATAKTAGEEKDASRESLAFDTHNPRRKVVELWIRRDVLGWGKPQEFVLFCDEESQKAIYYEFQAKVCPDMKRPFTAIAVGKTKNRWWGKSLPEKIQQYQLEADKQFNAELYRNKIRSNPFKGGDKSALKDPEEDLTSDPEKYIDVKNGRDLKEALQYVTLPDLDDRTQFIVDYIIRMVQLWLGVSNIAQGDYANLPENNTARGIEATLRESSKISRRWIRRIVRGLEEHVLKLVQIAMATIPENAVELYEFTEGKTLRLGQMTAKDIRSIEVNVRLRLSQQQNEIDITRAETALAVQERYWATPPVLQMSVRPLLTEILTALGYKNVDELLPLPQPMEQEPIAPPPPENEPAMVVPTAEPQGGATP
ncbi:MAG: hypothetical protein Q8M02_14625 [Candidatus Didemnitutus sp.]|nr:hypothetical protein [Candidatus Didemnitutus sp.]